MCSLKSATLRLNVSLARNEPGQRLVAATSILTACVVTLLVFLIGVETAFGQFDLERDPINYDSRQPQDPAAKIQQRIDNEELKLNFDPVRGYLESILKELKIPVSSQVLVFSKTSMQIARISPRTPRAVYFNDESYVGWIPGSDFIEVMSTDPEQGQIFYTLKQDQEQPGAMVRDLHRCLTCHASSRTENVPGVLARSVYSNRSGRPDYSAGTFNTDDRSPFEKRWGGWYVTGTHGEMRHMGNVTLKSQLESEQLDIEAGANVTDLSDHFQTARYPSPDSDIVALMVLNHQVRMHNLITLANYECRLATHSDAVINKALERPPEYQSETTQRRIASAGEKLVRALLFCEEYPLTDPVAGTTEFAKEFQTRGPFDQQGRSLRDFDLKTRLFKYPCSYLIYSPSFENLPAPILEYVSKRLREILSGTDQDEAFSHLSPADRLAIKEILKETLPELWTMNPELTPAVQE